MILDKALILKGLGGLTAVGGSAAAAYFGITSLGGDSPESLIEKAGLKCTFNGNECEITSLESGKKINVKNNTTKVEEKTFTISTSGPKIKVQKNVTEGGYNKNLKLTIEGGDIDLTGGTASGSGSTTITKLEEFETYEIKEEGDKWYLSRKTDALTGKSKALGLPDNCKLPSDNNTPTTCSNITKEQLKEIKFDGKGNGDVTVDGETVSITLKITKTSDNTTYPHGGYKFVFETTQNNITIPKTTSNESISIKKGTNTEFKIKKTENQLTLEKAWTVASLGEKVGLKCTGESSCTPGDTIKGYKNGNTTKEDATVGEAGKSKTISVSKDEENYNQGFKFTVSQEIELSTNSEKIVTGSYEIKEETGKWYLIKKD